MTFRRNPITAPPATPPRYSLLTAVGANGATSGNEAWEDGVAWVPEACGGSALSKADSAVQPAREPGDVPPRVVANPFYVWADDTSTSRGAGQRDWQGRARRRLEATQSYQIARELWHGDFTKATEDAGVDANGLPFRSPYLADTDKVVNAGANAQEAIGIAEAVAMDCSQGRRVMIHVPTFVLERAQATGSFVQRDTGGILTTTMGNIVVADAGYDGGAPDVVSDDDEQVWIYATSMVQVRLSAIETLPANLAGAADWAQAMGRAQNEITVWAQRLALYQLDPCCRIAVSTNVPQLPTIETP